MSLARSIFQSVFSDIRAAVLAPVNFAQDARYTINGLREGKIPPKVVAWSIISTIGAVALVSVLMFPIYWIFRMAVDPNMNSLYQPNAVILPQSVELTNFVWVIGSIVTPSNIVLQAPLIGTKLTIPLPEFISGITLLDATQYGSGTNQIFDPVRNTSNFIKAFENSMYVGVWTVIVGMLIVVPGAYGMSRRKFIGRKKLLYLYVLLTQVGGGLGIAVLIALFTIFTGMGWYDNKLAVSVYYAASAVPFNTWLLKTYMDGIPTSYEEAAVVDGAPSWRVIYEIIIPLSVAGLATVFIFIFLAGWMDYIVAATLLNEENFTLPVELYALQDSQSIHWGRFSAFALAFALPVMLVYMFAQRYIEAGLSFGGVEG